MNGSERICVKSVEVTVSRAPETAAPPDGQRVWLSDPTRRLHAAIEPAPWDPESETRLKKAAASGVLRLVIGDYTEPGVSAKDGRCANAALVELDFPAARARATSSLVGLPPIALQRGAQASSFSCPLLPRTRPTSAIDVEGIADTLRWGHPLDGRTMFREISIVPPLTVLTLSADGQPISEPAGQSPASPSYENLSQQQLFEAQITALLEAASRLPTTGAFLSLSGGLDSRTALVALLKSGREIPCVSMAGSPYALDARIARRFCESHGLAHQIVEFGDEYERRLPDLAVRSAALTGGVSCLSQTIDLYLYSKVPDSSRIRISGHLGNQVGRGGVESITAAGPSDSVFAEDLRTALRRRPMETWFIGRMAEKGYAPVLFEQEVHYWSVANYMLGSAHALQLSPYADVAVVEMAKTAISSDPRFSNPTAASIRQRDMRHRLFGPALRHSFQRATLARYDRSGDDVPINWGWRARGGPPRWTPDAMRTAVDALACKLGRRVKFLKSPAARLSHALGRPSALVAWPELLHGPLRSLACDTLLSAKVAESGLFENKRLRQLLDQHFSGHTDHHTTIHKALEIALGITSAPG